MSGIYANNVSSLASNPYASFSTTQTIANQILADPSFASITSFLNYPDPSNNADGWLSCYNILERYVNLNASNGITYSKNGFKFLLTLDDGTVIVDTSKDSKSVTTTSAVGAFAAGVYHQNSAVSYGNKMVNENHNSRPEVLNSVLSASGVGSARRYSSSSQSAYMYYAVRLGNSPQANVGTLRVAVTEYVKASDVAGKSGSSNDL